MTSWLENQKYISTKENTRRRPSVVGKKQWSWQNFWPNPIQSMDESNPCPTLLWL